MLHSVLTVIDRIILFIRAPMSIFKTGKRQQLLLPLLSKGGV